MGLLQIRAEQVDVFRRAASFSFDGGVCFAPSCPISPKARPNLPAARGRDTGGSGRDTDTVDSTN
jgi:hypothetical protein